jgi:hypothetical protein
MPLAEEESDMIGAEKFHPWLKRPCLEKKDAAAPDYTPVAQASEESSRIMAALGKDQLDFAKLQYEEAKPLFTEIVNSQISTQDKTNAQADEYYKYQQDTFRPVEEKLVADAQSYNTTAERERMAGLASADAGRAFANTQGATNRGLASMGVNPASGRFASTQNANALALAGQRAGAMNSTRTQAEATGYARSMDAAGLGRNLTGASQGAYSLALNAGNSAGQNQMAPGQQYSQGMAQGAATIGSGRQMLQSGLGDILNGQISMAGSANAANGAMGGAALGAAGGIAVAMI